MKKLFCAIAFAVVTMSAMGAFNFSKYIDGRRLYFAVTSPSTCEVVASPLEETLGFKVAIPATVTDQGVEFTVTSIGDKAFAFQKHVTEVQLPETIERIGKQAFLGCTLLENINLPSDVSYIGSEAFSRCEALTSLELPKGLTFIEDCAFSRIGIESLTIPEGVNTIGGGAFSYCKSLKTVDIPSSVSYIGNSAFSGCVALTQLELPKGLTSIEDYAFARLGIESLTIPEGVTSIGGGAFSCCKSLKTVKIPDSVTAITPGAFSGCDALASFEGKFASADGRLLVIDDVLTAFAPAGIKVWEVPETVTSIGASVMTNSLGLEELVVPNSVENIGEDAFYGCKSLVSVTLGNSVKSIGLGAFYCLSLKEICSLNPIPPVLPPMESEKTVFYPLLFTTATLYVPSASIEAYRNAEEWKYFENIKSYEDKVNSIADVVASAEDGDIYSMQGIKVKKTDLNTLPSGIYIHNGKKILVK